MATDVFMPLYCLLVSTVACVATACEPGWTPFRDSCYNITQYPYELYGSVLQSRWHCLQNGADLITIKTDEDQIFVEGMLTRVENGVPLVTRPVYIAAGDGPNEGVFQWFDGSLVGEGKKWSPPNPNNLGPGGIDENCVRVNSGFNERKNLFVATKIGTWLDVPCLEPLKYITAIICSKPRLPPSSGRQHAFRVMEKRYFDGHHIGQYTVSSYVHCLTMCLAQDNCLSANVRVQGSVSDNCVLNNATLWEDRQVMLNVSTGSIDPRQWTYYEVEYPAFRT